MILGTPFHPHGTFHSFVPFAAFAAPKQPIKLVCGGNTINIADGGSISAALNQSERSAQLKRRARAAIAGLLATKGSRQ